MEPCTRTEYNKTVKVMAAKEYFACLFFKQSGQQQYKDLKK